MFEVSNRNTRTNFEHIFTPSVAATGAVLQEKVFFEIPKNSQGKTCARISFLIKLQA